MFTKDLGRDALHMYLHAKRPMMWCKTTAYFKILFVLLIVLATESVNAQSVKYVHNSFKEYTAVPAEEVKVFKDAAKIPPQAEDVGVLVCVLSKKANIPIEKIMQKAADHGANAVFMQKAPIDTKDAKGYPGVFVKDKVTFYAVYIPEKAQ